jgi:hypothetical protein
VAEPYPLERPGYYEVVGACSEQSVAKLDAFNDELIHEAPAIVGRQTPSALARSARE